MKITLTRNYTELEEKQRNSAPETRTLDHSTARSKSSSKSLTNNSHIGEEKGANDKQKTNSSKNAIIRVQPIFRIISCVA